MLTHFKRGKNPPLPLSPGLFSLFGFILKLMKDVTLMALETETLYLAAEQVGQGS